MHLSLDPMQYLNTCLSFQCWKSLTDSEIFPMLLDVLVVLRPLPWVFTSTDITWGFSERWDYYSAFQDSFYLHKCCLEHLDIELQKSTSSMFVVAVNFRELGLEFWLCCLWCNISTVKPMLAGRLRFVTVGGEVKRITFYEVSMKLRYSVCCHPLLLLLPQNQRCFHVGNFNLVSTLIQQQRLRPPRPPPPKIQRSRPVSSW